MANPSILPIGNEGSVEQQPAVPSSITRRGLVALAAATALTGLSGQVGAETPAVSATASTSKGVGVGQMTSDGRDFSVLTEKEVDGLARAEKKRYYAWKEAQLDATIIGIKEERAGAQATLIAEKKGLEGDKTRVIAKYTEYIDLFNQLHAMRGKPGFDEKAYNNAKDFLQKTLLSGKPPEILPRLEKMRDIITA